SPFGHDGKVARLAGGLKWFAAVELIGIEGHVRLSTELLAVDGIEDHFDDALNAQWQAITAARTPLQLGERTIRLDQPQQMAVLNTTPDSLSDGGQYADAAAAAEAGARIAAEVAERRGGAVGGGVARGRVLSDAGVGFGKDVAHTLELMIALAVFHSLGCPLVVGASRKRAVGALSGEAPAEKRLGGSIALALKA